MKLTLQPKKSHSCQFHRVLLICWSLNWRYEPEEVRIISNWITIIIIRELKLRHFLAMHVNQL